MNKKINDPNTVIVHLQNPAHETHAPNEQQFQTWATKALVTPSHTCEVTIRIVDPDESATLNKTYRQKTGPTNVLSFSYPQTLEADQTYLGDIAICAELVSDTAEWAHLTVHGMLHLQGYDHQEDQDAEEMEQLETNILKILGFPNPYELT